MQYTSIAPFSPWPPPLLASAQTITLELVVLKVDGLGSPNNIVLIESLPDVSLINSVSWTDVTALGLGGPSWIGTLSSMGKLLPHSSPMKVRDRRVGKWGPTSGSQINLFSNELILEFFESFDDDANLIDAQYTGGTITISYGTLSDCNGNDSDAEELGPDTDCDASGVLDVENLTDCDANGVPDEGSAVPNDLKMPLTSMERCPVQLNAGEEATFGDQCSTAPLPGWSRRLLFDQPCRSRHD